MVSKGKLIGSLAGIGLLLGIVSGVVAAEMSQSHSAPQGKFEQIEQPLQIKVGVAVGGLFLIGLELWWFLWSKPKHDRK
jgi:plastocyanin domain-containing protein